MNNPLAFIANRLYDAISRNGMRAAATDLDSKRCRSWDEYGYPTTVSFDQLYTMWRRGGMAHGAVERLVDRCWSENPYLLEGTDSADDRDETPWEESMRNYADGIELWPAFADADRKRLVGGCSALILEAPGKWSEPVRRGAVTGVVPVWRNQLRALTREPVTERVKMWQYLALDGRTTTNVHPDRVFILGDWDDPLSFIEPAYNYLLNLDKICGGAGEGFLKNAARQLALEFAEGGSLGQLAAAMGKEPKEAQDVLNQMATDLNTGIDALFAVSGGKIAPIVAELPDPVGPADVNAQQATAAWQIPLKILIGNQTGERASTEDKRDFNALCQSRNTHKVYPDVKRFFQHLDRIKALPAPLPAEWSVGGPDLTEADTAERLANAKVLSEINKNGEAGGVTFTAEEIRTAAGYDATPTGTVPPLPDDQDLDDLPPDPSA